MLHGAKICLWTCALVAVAALTFTPLRSDTTHATSNFSHFSTQFPRDFTSDTSIQKFISTDFPLHDEKFTPPSRTTLDHPTLDTLRQRTQLRPEAATALANLADEFHQKFNSKLVITSAFRGFRAQKSLKNAGCAPTRCAHPGASEHQLGLAVDLQIRDPHGVRRSLSRRPDEFARLQHNAHKFGRHNSFQHGQEIDGYIVEHRHRRYLGTQLATELYHRDQTFTQFFTEIIDPKTPENSPENFPEKSQK